MGKSQLLVANRHLSPKSLFVSDASGAGLTAAVVDVDGKKVMQAGVLVLANNGVACIDEFDKIKKEDRDAIHTAMEQGIIEKSKAGLHGSFKANTAILAAANPKYHRFDANMSLSDQIGLEDTILNRFDLIFFFVDQKKTKDAEFRKAAMVLSDVSTGDDGILRKYVAYARRFSPSIGQDIAERIAEFYASTRTESSGNGMPANLRSLESMRRICEASAKVRLSDKVEDVDVEIMRSIFQVYLQGINYDMDTISGFTSKVRNAMERIEDALSAKGGRARMEDLREMLPDLSDSDIEEAIRKMKLKGDVYESRNGVFEVVR
ncbi:ATP-binding protein [Acidiplasma sp.]|uniref:ATP-binding protein n=1 Tax=Acidiplasma sp. TaxID=1872114 RepID=UPI00258E2B03|nr:ATP-binding protein [Acidiplasma sp.]